MHLILYAMILIVAIVMFYLFKKRYRKLRNIKFDIKNLPYLYQSEWYSLAWGHEHSGFFIDPQGIKYCYKMSKDYQYVISNKWNWITTSDNKNDSRFKHAGGYEVDGRISPNDLFENLSNSVEDRPWFSFKSETNFIITQEMIDDLLKSPIEDYGQVMCDAGLYSNSLYVYDSESNSYRRILLSCDGDIKKVNTCKHTQSIITQFGTVFRNS